MQEVKNYKSVSVSTFEGVEKGNRHDNEIGCDSILLSSSLERVHVFEISCITCSGHRIGTAEVESALVSHPQCAEAAVVGVEHEVIF